MSDFPELIERIIPRLSNDERRIMALPTVQLAMLGGDKGITIERHEKVPTATIKSLIARGLARSNIDSKFRIMPLSGLGVQINETLTGERFKCGHERTQENTKIVRAGTGTACLRCFRKNNREYVAAKRTAA